MTETLIFLCTLCILTPVLIVAVIIYNLRRQMKGLKSASGGDALQDIIQQLFNVDVKNPGKRSTSSSNKSPSKAKKVAEKKLDAEDAEFREIKS